MTRALRIQIAGSYYHVTCRGNERRAIFRDDTDRQAFLDKLQRSLVIYQVELHAYVLMSNHFHLMVRTLRGNLAEFMRHFNISYTLLLNGAIAGSATYTKGATKPSWSTRTVTSSNSAAMCT